MEPRWSSRHAGSVAGLEPSRDARDLSDLAAFSLLHSLRADEPELAVRALDLANRVQDPAVSPPEALFNRALTRDRLFLTGQAEDAWFDYLAVDRDSAWSDVARARLSFLREASSRAHNQREIANLRRAAEEGDQASVRKIIEAVPQPARELALEDLLGSWGDRFLQGDITGAARRLRAASELGRALLASGGDRSVDALAAAVARAQESLSQIAAAKLARAHQSFREGMSSFRKLAIAQARLSFAATVAEARDTGSPIELWAKAGAARIHAYDGAHEAAEETFRTILAEASRRSFVSLAAWCNWGLGWIDSRRGRFDAASRHFLAAERAYSQLREAENQAAIDSFLAENLASLGQAGEAWRYRQRILATLADYPASLRRHVALIDAAHSAVEAGLTSAALAIQEEALRAAVAEKDPIRLAEGLWGRSRILARLGRIEEAGENLERASAQARRAPPGSPRDKLFADLNWARGEVLSRLQPKEAVRLLSAAIRSYEEQKIPLSFAYASFSRARLLLRGATAGEAEEDIGRALQVLEDLGAHVEEADLRTSYADSIQDIYDELIRSRWLAGRHPLDALVALERARHLGASPEAPWKRTQEQRAGEADSRDATTIEYGLLRDRLLIWIMRGGSVASCERPIGQKELERRVENFREAILRGDPTANLQDRASTLYDLLIPDGTGDGNDLYLVLDKGLNRLPFGALFNLRSRKFLVQEHSITLIPDLAIPSSQPRFGAFKAPASALLVADPAIDGSFFSHSLPRLPGARAEVEAIRPLFPSSVLLEGREATRDRIVDEMSRTGIFVFAGHAVSNAGRPSRSYLVVAPAPEDGEMGMLFAKDLAGRSFPDLRVAVLSACSSVGPTSSRYLGITGLARPFLAAGVQSVLGSLWRVEDRQTPEFLRTVYRDLAAGYPAVEALRRAQLQAVSRPERAWREISAWAAFVCVSSPTATERR